MRIYEDICIASCGILLPKEGTDMQKWAVVACDQYTSQPEYWHETARIAGDAPSCLNLIYPEAFLSDGDKRIDAINAAMRSYMCDGVLEERVNGFVLTERITPAGARVGLLAALDLEQYDFAQGSRSPIRPTEGTILSRIPPRVKIRRNAPIELPHIMMLIDDAKKTVLEPLYARRDTLRKLYDFELMQGGGHIRGWAVEGAEEEKLVAALRALREVSGDIFIAAGDGNHSLATARQCWLDLRESLSEEERRVHPARYALCELVNLHEDAMRFEPIHRVLKNVSPEGFLADFRAYCAENGLCLEEGERDGHVFRFVYASNDRTFTVRRPAAAIDVGTIQIFADAWLAAHPQAAIDYVHGEDAVRALAAGENTLGILLRPMDKAILFPAVSRDGALPRKTFSMGEAFEKRYYLEAKRI